MIVADGSHQTAAQRGGEAKDKDKPLPDLQRDRCSPHMQGADRIKSAMCFGTRRCMTMGAADCGLASMCIRGSPRGRQS